MAVTSGRDGGGGGGGGVGLLFALTLGRRPEITHEVIPAAGAKDVTTA